MIRHFASAAPRLRRMCVLALGAGTALTLAACGSGSDTGAAAKPAASKSPAPQGIITIAAAKAVVDSYESANNRANKARDERLLSTVESGQLNEQSAADYKQYPTWSAKKKKEYGTSFFYQNRTYYIPAAGTASWFAVKATSSYGDHPEALLIFDKTGGSGTYKMTMAFYTPKDEPFPTIAVDKYGLAQVANPSQKVGERSPSELGGLYEDFFESGGTKKAAKVFASSDSSKESTKVYQERNDGKLAAYTTKKYFAQDPAHPTVYALKLAGGGVVTGFPTAHTQEEMLKPQYMSSFQIGPNDEEAVYDQSKRTVITDTFQGQGLAEMSPASKPKVLSIEYRMTDSR
ncbi:hypothetical protein ABZ896_19940 [Streptomyces sp. NPDC047072]|uniref:hypothetical protein n=1 Tax=Streptomyces sp. NPDC047072 TaxID=3154809 RepID=UPI00340C26CF